MNRLSILLLLVLAGCSGSEPESSSLPVQGVTDDAIVIGTHNDLSGLLATWGVPYTNALRMRFDAANAAGGIHGRMIRLVMEDTQYQMPLAVKAVNKLLNVDRIFVMVGGMGTPMNVALMPQLFEANVPNLFPLTGAMQMYEPLHPLKFSAFVSYRDQVRAGMHYMVEKYGMSKVCLQAIANDYGEENVLGFEQAVEELGIEVVYTGRHKNTETDFVGTIAAIKNSGCEMLVLAPLVRDAILIYSAARDAGWDAPIISNMVAYVDEVAGAANGATEGLYAAANYYVPDFDAVAPGSWLDQWHKDYVARFGEEPAPQSIIGYISADLVVRALEGAGQDLTVNTFLAALESIDYYEDPFGGPSMSFSPIKHQGGDFLYFYQVQNGKWEIVESNLPY